MSKIITKKQQTIITLIFTFRFINSKQIQEFLQHKDHRRINSWLKDLTEKEYIERYFKPVFGTLTKPAVYYLNKKGRDYIREVYGNWHRQYLARLREDKKRSKGFRIRCQVLADCFLILFKDQIAEYPKIITEKLFEGTLQPSKKFRFFTPALYDEMDFDLIPHLKPDAYAYLQKHKKINHILFYVVDAYVPKIMLHNYLKRIFTTLAEEHWENENIASLQFYFICPNNMVIIYLKRLLSSLIEGYFGDAELIFLFATRNQLYMRKQNNAASTNWIIISSTDD
jgi:DNA-binding PadR family transcriptional regulator